MTYQELLEDYLFSRVLRPASEQTYRVVFAKITRDLPGSSPDCLERNELLAWRKRELDRGLAPISWNTYVRHYRAVFNHGIEHGRLPYTKNPFKGLMVTTPSKRKKTLARAQIGSAVALFRMNDSETRFEPLWFWRAVFETFYHTGIRIQQLLHIRVRDIHLNPKAAETSFITLRTEGSKTHREYDVPIADPLHPYLKQLLKECRARKFLPDDQAFNVNKFSHRYRRAMMNGDQVQGFYKKLSKRLGYKVSPHRFRHTIGTDLLNQPDKTDGNLKLVQALLGHQSIRTTLEYVYPDQQAIRRMLAQRRPYR